MLKIICINAHNYLGRGAEYVNILFDMVRRNLSESVAFDFVCFTDTPQGINENVKIFPLPHEGLTGWWNKLALFKPGLFADGDRILYFDLDTVITSGLDEIVKYSGKFCALRDFFYQHGVQSSVLAWEANTQTHIWTSWLEAGMPKVHGGDQAWIEKCITPDYWQDLYPDSFVSYKVHALMRIPKKACVVVFHGTPRPHELMAGWVTKVWKIGGGTTLELKHVCNTHENILIDHIKSSLKQPFPWLQMVEPHDGHAVIVGGGPSLKQSLQEIKQRHLEHQMIFATNNTFSYLAARDILPQCHVMVDAREENSQFVPEFASHATCYYASQLHPSCLEKAHKNGNHIIMWHSMDAGIQEYIGWDTGDPLVGGGETVGMKSIALAHILGYRKFHLYGFDSCYENGENHAYRQPLNDKEKIIEVEMNDKIYTVAPWMCTQVENFKEVAHQIVTTGGIITVHGYGLLPDVARTMTIKMAAAQIRANEILSRLNIENPVGAEIGVFAADLSSRLLQRKDLTLYMVDSWATSDENSEYAKSGDFHAKLTQEQQDAFFEHTCASVESAGERAKILRKPSIVAAQEIPDASLDFVFIDADHSYEGCKADIRAWLPKLKGAALLSGHDYKNVDYPCFGVEKAVDEFCEENKLPVELGENFTWFVRLPGMNFKQPEL